MVSEFDIALQVDVHEFKDQVQLIVGVDDVK